MAFANDRADDRAHDGAGDGAAAGPVMSPARREALLWLAQRASAAVLALCVIVHLATMILAVRGGLSAAEILARTRGSAAWPAFYGVFVLAVAIHAPIGLRTVLAESSGGHRRRLDLAMAAFALLLLAAGLRAVYAVTVG
jgi:fumarate reductase subunit C